MNNFTIEETKVWAGNFARACGYEHTRSLHNWLRSFDTNSAHYKNGWKKAETAFLALIPKQAENASEVNIMSFSLSEIASFAHKKTSHFFNSFFKKTKTL